jgi:hypothetical protein
MLLSRNAPGVPPLVARRPKGIDVEPGVLRPRESNGIAISVGNISIEIHAYFQQAEFAVFQICQLMSFRSASNINASNKSAGMSARKGGCVLGEAVRMMKDGEPCRSRR